MSAATVLKPLELPVWVVHGFNWTAKVPLDEFNAQFNGELQAYEAATKAFAAILGEENAAEVKMDEGHERPSMGTTMIAHLVDTDPLKGHVVYSHVVFANEGKYKESIEMERAFNKEIEKLAKELADVEAQKAADAPKIKRIKKSQPPQPPQPLPPQPLPPPPQEKDLTKPEE